MKFKEGDKVKLIKQFPIDGGSYTDKGFIVGNVYKVFFDYDKHPFINPSNFDIQYGWCIDTSFNHHVMLYTSDPITIKTEQDYYKWLAGDRE